jgi:hypothetical protein
MIHCDNRAAAAIAMGISATGVAVSGLLIATHDRLFSGDIHVQPDVLMQVRLDLRLLSRGLNSRERKRRGLAFGPPHDSFALCLPLLLVGNGCG